MKKKDIKFVPKYNYEHWINAFVNTMNNDYEYVKLEDNIQSIRHKM